MHGLNAVMNVLERFRLRRFVEPLYLFVFEHYPTHRSGIRNQSSELISPRRRYALLLEML
ncbi:hypothetical protein D8666_17165 [Ochrobactrum soli]|nr:hypothetical protein D8666_17165 [[Ochrobactrum] soli]